MKKSVWLIGASAIAAAGLAQAATSRPENASRQSLCRRAPALEILPPESRSEDGQNRRSHRPRATPYEGAPPPSPPAPPPAPIVSPVVAPPMVAAPRAERGGDEESVEVTGSARMADALPEARAERAGPAAIRGGAQLPPAGLLTAGDHDDVLNPLLYARYARDAARQIGQYVDNLPVLDTSRVLTVEVEDSSGRAAPFVPVKLTCADGNSLTFTTQADGTVQFFPTLDRLGQRVTIEAGGARRSVDIAADAGGQAQRLVTAAPARAVRKLDLMIALDTTGSMGDEISFLQSELRAILDDVRRRHPGLDLRVGLVAYRDIGDEFVTRTTPLTADFEVLQRQLARQSGRGGGDTPEAMEQALIRAVGQKWRDDAVKSLLLVADAPPHNENVGRAFAAAEAARARRVHIVPVAASGVDDTAQYLMRAMAAATQSRYVFLTDDSGIGNPHAEPSVDCYVVTKLASAIRRVIDSQLSGQRIEPYPEEVIRVVGQYDHGRCILPPNWQGQ